MFGAGDSSAGAAAAAAAAAREVRLPLRVHPSQSAASLLRHVSWGSAVTEAAPGGGGDAAEGRPLLAGTLRASRSGSFARLKSLSLGGAGYDATREAAEDGYGGAGAQHAPGGEGSASGAPEGRRGAWHRCNASVGAAPAFVAHFALGTGTFIQGCVPAALALRPSHTPSHTLQPYSLAPTLTHANTLTLSALRPATTKPRSASC
jgi:hypothetical protein